MKKSLQKTISHSAPTTCQEPQGWQTEKGPASGEQDGVGIQEVLQPYQHPTGDEPSRGAGIGKAGAQNTWSLAIGRRRAETNGGRGMGSIF